MNVYEFDAVVEVAGKKGKAMLDQIRAIDKSRVGKKICSLSLKELEDVERALKIVVGIS